MSTLKTNNIEHLDASTPSIQTTIGGGTILAGVTTVSDALSVGTGTSISSPATNELALGTNDVERVRIDSDGKVLVGTETNVDDYLFQVDSSAFRTAQFTRYTSDGATVVIGSSRGTQSSRTALNINDYGGLIEFKAYEGSDFSSLGRISGQCEAAAAVGDTPGRLVFWTTADNASSPTERMRITSDGEVRIANGNLKFSTAGTGIDFSATSDGSGTATSELLDDYEEGTWTPELADAATGGNVATATANGRYVKIGSQVTVSLDLTNINTSGLTGGNAIYIRNLPYTIPNYTGTIRYTGPTAYSNMTLSNNYTNMMFVIQDSHTYMRLLKTSTSSADTASAVTISQIASGSADIRGSVVYSIS